MIQLCNFDIFFRNSFGYKSCDIRTIGLVCLTFLTLTMGHPVSETVFPDNPCSHHGELTETIRPEHRAIDDLVYTAGGLIHIVDSVKESMSTYFTPSEMPKQYFLPEESFSLSRGNFSTDVVDPAEMFRYFYEESLKLDKYVVAANNFSALWNQTTVVAGLRNASRQINKLLCEIWLEFRIYRGDHQTLTTPTSIEISQSFIIPDEIDNFYNKSKRAIIILNDCDNLMRYFIAMLNRFNESVTQV